MGIHGPNATTKCYKQRISMHFVWKTNSRFSSAPFIPSGKKGRKQSPQFTRHTKLEWNHCPVNSMDGSLCSKQHSKLFTYINLPNWPSKPVKSALLLTPILRMRNLKNKEVISIPVSILLPEPILIISFLLNLSTSGIGCSNLELWSLGARNGPGTSI